MVIKRRRAENGLKMIVKYLEELLVFPLKLETIKGRLKIIIIIILCKNHEPFILLTDK